MARKHYDGKGFAYRINILDRETYEDDRRRRKVVKHGYIHASDRWRKLRHEDIIMYLVFQILRYKRQIRRPWYCYYEVHGYGAPGEKEFLCPITSMRASTIRPEFAFQYRRRYALLVKKSQEILIWLLMLPPTEYTQQLHHQLLRYVIINRPHDRQVDAYRKSREESISRALQ